MRTDVEKLKVWGQKAGGDAISLVERIDTAKGAVDKAGGLWPGRFGAIKSRTGAVVAGTADMALMSVGAPTAFGH